MGHVACVVVNVSAVGDLVGGRIDHQSGLANRNAGVSGQHALGEAIVETVITSLQTPRPSADAAVTAWPTSLYSAFSQ